MVNGVTNEDDSGHKYRPDVQRHFGQIPSQISKTIDPRCQCNKSITNNILVSPSFDEESIQQTAMHVLLETGHCYITTAPSAARARQSDKSSGGVRSTSGRRVQAGW